MRTAVFLVSLLVAGSAYAQKLEKPNVRIPAEWSGRYPALVSVDPDSTRSTNNGGVHANLDSLREWWKNFGDPILISLVEAAIESNPDLKTAAARVHEARAVRGVAGSALKPSVTTSQGYTRVRGGIAQGLTGIGGSSPTTQSRESFIAPYETDVFQIGFDSFWELDLVGGLRKNVKAADADARAAEEAANDVRVFIAAEVGRNYIALRGAQRRLRILRENIALQQESLRLTALRRNAGLVPELDVIRATAQLRQTMAEAPPLEAEIDRAIYALSVLQGRPPADLATELRAEHLLPVAAGSFPATVPADLLLRRPDLRRSSAEVVAAAARVGVARAELYPKLTLAGLVGRQAASLGGLALGIGNFFSIGPLLRLPLFTGGRIRSNIAAEKARLEQATSLYEAAVLNAFADVEKALSAYSREKDRERELAAAESHNRDAVALTSELYAKGLGDYLAVLDAQRQLLATEQHLAQSATAVSLHLVDLYTALGGGW